MAGVNEVHGFVSYPGYGIDSISSGYGSLAKPDQFMRQPLIDIPIVGSIDTRLTYYVGSNL